MRERAAEALGRTGVDHASDVGLAAGAGGGARNAEKGAPDGEGGVGAVGGVNR